MIIEDIDGGKLQLSKTRLTEIDHTSTYPYYLNFSELWKEFKTMENNFITVYINGKDGMGYPVKNHPVTLDIAFNQIGCRVFSPKTFAKILKAAGVRKTNKKTKKAKRA